MALAHFSTSYKEKIFIFLRKSTKRLLFVSCSSSEISSEFMLLTPMKKDAIAIVAISKFLYTLYSLIENCIHVVIISWYILILCESPFKMSFRIKSTISKGESTRKTPLLLLMISLSDQKVKKSSISWSQAQFFKSLIRFGESYYMNIK